MSLKAQQLAQALTTKGFVRDSGDHAFYYLLVDGAKTDVRTKISHGEREISSSLLGLIRRQMGALSAEEFEDFVDCRMSGAAYRQLLEEGQVMPPPTPYKPVWERRRRPPREDEKRGHGRSSGSTGPADAISPS